MRVPVLPLLSNNASLWYYNLPADERRRMADLMATVLSGRMYDAAPGQLSPIESLIVQATVRQRFVAARPSAA
jgi:hypothetical protein